MRRLAAALLITVAGAAPAAAQDLCGRLFIPEGYAETCRTVSSSTGRSQDVLVGPVAGRAIEPAQLDLRELVRADEPLAWEAPERWLEAQLAVDVSGLTTALRGSADAPGSLLGHPSARLAVEGLAASLEDWGRLPLSGCTSKHEPPRRHELACTWGSAPLTLGWHKLLVSDGERRFALGWRASDPQHLRHLEAIANSFDGG